MGFVYKDIRKTIRFKERDNDEIRFSDYEIKEATNEALRYISNELADTNADFNEKIMHYHDRDLMCKIHGTVLPEDFISLVAVKGDVHSPELLTPCGSANTPMFNEYKIQGNRIYCGSPHFVLVYKARISEVEDDDDEIELPYYVKDKFVTYVRRILTQADENIMSDAEEEIINALTPKRRYRNAHIRMPFKV